MWIRGSRVTSEQLLVRPITVHVQPRNNCRSSVINILFPNLFLADSHVCRQDSLVWTRVLIGPPEKTLSLPAFLRLVGLLLLPLPLPSHLLQLLSVFPLDEALLMSHLWEVIWYRERQSGKRREVDQGEQIKRETHRGRGVRRQGQFPTGRGQQFMAQTLVFILSLRSNEQNCCRQHCSRIPLVLRFH